MKKNRKRRDVAEPRSSRPGQPQPIRGADGIQSVRYFRSSDTNESSEVSKQQEELKTFAEEQGLKIMMVYQECNRASDGIDERSAFRRMVRQVECGMVRIQPTRSR